MVVASMDQLNLPNARQSAEAAGDGRVRRGPNATSSGPMVRGEPQVYGSQASITDGRVIFAPIADSAGVDARRAEMGLPSLSEYRRVLDSVYLGRRVP
jgi:hypothetical protein